jgi:predicted metalloprotease with PDZ domain
MSGELWFAEGFTSYYTGLILCRAGLRSEEDYVKGLAGTFNYVWNSPGRNFFNPIEMSYQAPFVDAARSVDAVNRDNTFISYYSYGSALGLALDLSLREQGLNLDDYMKLVWTTYGKVENPYTVNDLHQALNKFAGKSFGDNFFNNYVYKSEMPQMQTAFENVGVSLTKNSDQVWFGRSPREGKLVRNTIIDSPAYEAGLENGDTIISLGDFVLSDALSFNDALNNFKPNDKAKVVYERFGEQKETEITFKSNPRYSISVFEANDLVPTETQKVNRDAWLSGKN